MVGDGGSKKGKEKFLALLVYTWSHPDFRWPPHCFQLSALQCFPSLSALCIFEGRADFKERAERLMGDEANRALTTEDGAEVIVVRTPNMPNPMSELVLILMMGPNQ